MMLLNCIPLACYVYDSVDNGCGLRRLAVRYMRRNTFRWICSHLVPHSALAFEQLKLSSYKFRCLGVGGLKTSFVIVANCGWTDILGTMKFAKETCSFERRENLSRLKFLPFGFLCFRLKKVHDFANENLLCRRNLISISRWF